MILASGEKRADARPVTRMSIDRVMARDEFDPAFGSAPGVVEPLRVLEGDHFVVRRDDAEQRRFDLRREAKRIEAVLEQQADGKKRIVALADFRHAVERRDENQPEEAPLGGEPYGDAATEAAAERINARILLCAVVVPGKCVRVERALRRRAG